MDFITFEAVFNLMIDFTLKKVKYRAISADRGSHVACGPFTSASKVNTDEWKLTLVILT